MKKRLKCFLLGILSGIILTGPGVNASAAAAQLRFVQDDEAGTLTIEDGGSRVLTYRFGDQLKEGVDVKYTRSCYIHPLFSLDGQVLTEDFPEDHAHHHGVFWTWPVVKTRGHDTQTWHPAVPSLRQHFVRWRRREVDRDRAFLQVETAWRLEGDEVVAEENLTLVAHPADAFGRAIDIEIVLQAVGGPLELGGSPEANKGYGGLCVRGAAVFQGAVMSTEKGVLEQDVTNVRFRWADISTRELGLAVFVSPDHPDFPTPWLIRNSYAGVINPSWPGLEGHGLRPGQPVTLRYRIYIHRGDAESGRVPQAYALYVSQQTGTAPTRKTTPLS